MKKNPPLTALLRRWRGGDEAAREELVELVYPELEQLARRRLRSERRDHTLSSKALVNEAYMRLAGSTNRSERRCQQQKPGCENDRRY